MRSASRPKPSRAAAIVSARSSFSRNPNVKKLPPLRPCPRRSGRRTLYPSPSARSASGSHSLASPPLPWRKRIVGRPSGSPGDAKIAASSTGRRAEPRWRRFATTVAADSSATRRSSWRAGGGREALGGHEAPRRGRARPARSRRGRRRRPRRSAMARRRAKRFTAGEADGSLLRFPPLRAPLCRPRRARRRPRRGRSRRSGRRGARRGPSSAAARGRAAWRTRGRARSVPMLVEGDRFSAPETGTTAQVAQMPSPPHHFHNRASASSAASQRR